MFAEEKRDVTKQELELCGYFCIISSETMTAQEAYSLYRGRDASEKLFRSDKSFLGARSQRVYSNEAVQAKIFIEFVALIIRNRFYNLLKEQMCRLVTRRNTMTVPGAIRELEKIVRILICVNGVLKHVNTPDSYLRERCANIVDSVRSLA